MNETIRYIAAGFAFALGAIFGSFANVLIYRLPRGLSITTPVRSFCPVCGCTIPWYDNIPIISFLLLRAKCRFCHAPISVRYILVESLCGTSFAAAAFLYMPNLVPTLHLAALGFFSTTTAFIALKGSVPWRLWLAGILVGLAFIVFDPLLNKDFFKWMPLPSQPSLVMERVRCAVGTGLLAGSTGGVTLSARLIVNRLGWNKPQGSPGGGAMFAFFLKPDTFIILLGISLVASSLISLLISAISHRRVKLPYILILAPTSWLSHILGYPSLV